MGKRRAKKQPPVKMSIATRSCQDGRRYTIHGPSSSPASTPDLFGDGLDGSPPPSPEIPDPAAIPSVPTPGSSVVDGAKEPTLADVLAIIKVNHADLVGKVDGLKIDLTIMRQDVHKLRGWVTKTEQRISDLEDTIAPILPRLNTYGGKITTLEDKVHDLENRLRRNNLRLVGLPERVEGSDPVAFLESWLEQEFGREQLSPCFVIERAHRVLGRPLPEGHPHVRW